MKSDFEKAIDSAIKEYVGVDISAFGNVVDFYTRNNYQPYWNHPCWSSDGRVIRLERDRICQKCGRDYKGDIHIWRMK